MTLITLIVLLPVLLFFPVATGIVATTLGRKFWFWFLAGISLPFLALVILLCMPVRKQKIQAAVILKSRYTKMLFTNSKTKSLDTGGQTLN